MGASGAGNTTLGRVLLGLTQPDEGVVLAGGQPLCELDQWRSNVAWAPQHPTLVPGTVAENIALGRPDASAAAVANAGAEVNAFLSWADEFYLRPHHRSAALLHPSTVDTPRHRLERLGARRTGRGALERGDGVFDPEVAAILTPSG